MVRKNNFFGGIVFSLCVILLLTVLASFSALKNGYRPSTVLADLDDDGTAEEYCLVNHSLFVREGNKVLWQSPPDWCVDNLALGDIDNDGNINLIITLWKTGSFGPVQPFWQETENRSYKNHLFVYRLSENILRAVWCSSDLDRPIVSLAVRDGEGDSRRELVVQEGQYRKKAEERYALDPWGPVRTTVWQWEEWGFRLTRPR